MERRIGEIFTYQDKTYQVVKSIKYDNCTGCAFKGLICGMLTCLDTRGNCSMRIRKDHNDIIFKEIKNMENNQLVIDIPKGMEIDVENTNLAKGIVKFRPKNITYDDIVKSLDIKRVFGITVFGEHKNKLQAIARLLIIAKYYNGDWKPDWNNIKEGKFYISYNFIHNNYFVIEDNSNSIGSMVFKHQEDAQAIIDNPNFRSTLDAIYKN